MSNELFEIESRDKTARLFSAIYKWGAIFLISSVISGIFYCINAIKLIRFYLDTQTEVPRSYKVQTIASITFLIFSAIMFILQALFFFRFAAKMKSIRSDENVEPFNSSFTWLMRQAAIAAIYFAFNAIWGIIDVLFFYS